jgi:hypothetical protein
MAMRGVKTIYFDKPYTSMPDNERDERKAIMDHFNMSIYQLVDEDV